jgi:hypothetical protein
MDNFHVLMIILSSLCFGNSILCYASGYNKLGTFFLFIFVGLLIVGLQISFDKKDDDQVCITIGKNDIFHMQ